MLNRRTGQRELKRMHDTGEYSITDLGELFSVSRPTVYRTIRRVITEPPRPDFRLDVCDACRRPKDRRRTAGASDG
jgi:predicted DNA-binding protein YlxM (UPF0122 family)